MLHVCIANELKKLNRETEKLKTNERKLEISEKYVKTKTLNLNILPLIVTKAVSHWKIFRLKLLHGSRGEALPPGG